MATTLQEITDLAEHPGFVRRVRPAMVKAAIAVGNEQNDESQRALMRRALAQNVLLDGGVWAARFAWALAANPAITLESSDSDLEWTVASVWDAIAGADPAPEPEPEP